MHRIGLLQIVLTVAFLLSCAPKKFVWQGQHITIATAEHPREDFEAGEYIVVAYAPIEYKKCGGIGVKSQHSTLTAFLFVI